MPTIGMSAVALLCTRQLWQVNVSALFVQLWNRLMNLFVSLRPMARSTPTKTDEANRQILKESVWKSINSIFGRRYSRPIYIFFGFLSATLSSVLPIFQQLFIVRSWINRSDWVRESGSETLNAKCEKINFLPIYTKNLLRFLMVATICRCRNMWMGVVAAFAFEIKLKWNAMSTFEQCINKSALPGTQCFTAFMICESTFRTSTHIYWPLDPGPLADTAVFQHNPHHHMHLIDSISIFRRVLVEMGRKQSMPFAFCPVCGSPISTRSIQLFYYYVFIAGIYTHSQSMAFRNNPNIRLVYESVNYKWLNIINCVINWKVLEVMLLLLLLQSCARSTCTFNIFE